MTMRRLPLTERAHPRSVQLDLATPGEVVRWLNAEDGEAVKAVKRVLPRIAQVATAAAQCLRQGGRLVYVGAGTSGRLGALDAAEIPPTFGTERWQVVALVAGGPAALTRSIEGAEDDAAEGARAIRRLRAGRRDVVCGISASGTTPYVLGALRAAHRAGAKTAMVCCNPPGRAVPGVDWVVAPLTGPELIAGSTRLKAGTATKLVLNSISTAAMVSLGKVYRGRMVDLAPSNRKLLARAAGMVAELAGLSPPKAAALLERAGGSPRVALAMAFTGKGRRNAERLLQAGGLRKLEPPPPPRRAKNRG